MRTFFTSNSFIVFRLTGAYVLDHTTASMCDPFYDSATNSWDAEWIAELVPALRFPTLAWPSEIIGVVTEAASHASAIPVGTPVACGAMDFWAENIGCGTETPGDCMLAYGTTMSVSAVTDRLVAKGDLWTAPGSSPTVNHVGGATSTAGALASWVCDRTSAPDQVTLAAEAARVAAGSHGLLMLPYFSGERAPIHDPDARGVVVGLSLSHGRAELYRAALEAIALSVRHVFETISAAGVTVTRLVAVGGGLRDELWPQIVSDVLQLPQDRPAVTLGAPYGDALIAARAVGAAAPGSWGEVGAVIRPIPEHARRYDELYTAYRDLDRATREVSHRLVRLARDN
jgi:xylulokinase